MSHAATKWAFDQPELNPDMKPSEWAVLMVLADCHNPVNGCFPSQDYIAQKTNLAERAVRDNLNRLKGRGLVMWEACRSDGRRGANRYRLAFEDDFLPADSAGRASGENARELPADSDQSNRQNLPPNLVREPVREPERESAREREGDSPEPPATGSGAPAGPPTADGPDSDAAFQAVLGKANQHAGPQAVGRCYPLWRKLDAASQAALAARFDAMVAAWRNAGRKHAYGLERIIRDRMWEQVPAPESGAPKTLLALRSGEWFAAFWAAFAADDRGRCRAMLRAAAMGVGYGCDAADVPSRQTVQTLPKVPADGPQWAAWRRVLAAKGLPLHLTVEHAAVPAWPWVPSEWPPDEAENGSRQSAVGAMEERR